MCTRITEKRIFPRRTGARGSDLLVREVDPVAGGGAGDEGGAAENRGSSGGFSLRAEGAGNFTAPLSLWGIQSSKENHTMINRKTAAVAFAAALSLASAPALAQNVNANNLVTVNISNVANDIARNLSVDVSQIPVTVQAPIGVAANVCNVEANVLAEGGADGPAECDAETSSQALTQLVQRQIG